MKNKWVFVYPLLLLLYSVYSYSQTTPNLVLSSHPVFWQFQEFMWQLGYHQRALSSLIYGLLVIALFGVYGLMVNQAQHKLIDIKRVILIFGLSVAALLPSYPALSNDIFNYLMNAKMMHVYGASPYQHAAWDFPDEPWLKFMMNVHTTTPYGYVWTGLGYLVYWLTLGDLQLGMLGFRLLAVTAVIACSWSVWILSKKNLKVVALFCLNPLVLLEAINNTHNDITMMALFMVGLVIFELCRSHNIIAARLGLGILWLASVCTKLITVISPFVYVGFILIKKWLKKLELEYFDVLALALVVVMVADGAKRFFSWYLLWSLPVAVLAQNKFARSFVIGLSFGGLMSYLPFLYTGEYTDYLGYIRYLLFFVPGFLVAGIHLVGNYFKSIRNESK